MTDPNHILISGITSCRRAQSCLTLCNPMKCSPPGSSVCGIPRQEYWSALLFPTRGDLPDPGTEFTSFALAGGFCTHCASWEAHIWHNLSLFTILHQFPKQARQNPIKHFSPLLSFVHPCRREWQSSSNAWIVWQLQKCVNWRYKGIKTAHK